MKKFRFAFMSIPLLLFIPSCTNDGEKAKGCSPWHDSIIKGTDFESHSNVTKEQTLAEIRSVLNNRKF